MQRITSLGSLALALSACGTIRLDAEEVDTRLDRIHETIPLCRSEGGASLSRAARELITLRRGLPTAESSTRLRAGSECGGSLSATSDHNNGTTKWEIVFDDWCVETDEGDAVMAGTLRYVENGRPSPEGPIVSNTQASTDGPLVITHPEGTVELTVRDATTRYANPAPFGPEPATEDAPNMISIAEIRIGLPDADPPRTDTLQDVRWEQVGTAEQEIRIVGGTLGTVGDGHVDISTVEDEPLILDVGELSFTGGAVSMTGRGGTELIARPDPRRPGVVALELDGEALERDVDCRDAIPALPTMGFRLLQALPL